MTSDLVKSEDPQIPLVSFMGDGRIFSIIRGDLRGFKAVSGQKTSLMETSQVFAAIY
jgi:hypothetical protein